MGEPEEPDIDPTAMDYFVGGDTEVPNNESAMLWSIL